MNQLSIDKWLLEDVVPVYDAMVANPARGLPASDVFKEIRSIKMVTCEQRKVEPVDRDL